MIAFITEQASIIFKTQKLASVLPDAIWDHISQFGELNILLSMFLALSVALGSKRFFTNISVVIICSVLVTIIKEILKFPRPASLLDLAQLHIIGDQLCCKSMPSGHAASAALIFTLVALICRSIALKAIAFVLMLLIGISRIVVGAHWPQDVIVSFLLVPALTYLFYSFLVQFQKYIPGLKFFDKNFKYFTIGCICLLLAISLIKGNFYTVFIAAVLSIALYILSPVLVKKDL